MNVHAICNGGCKQGYCPLMDICFMTMLIPSHLRQDQLYWRDTCCLTSFVGEQCMECMLSLDVGNRR